MNWERPRHRLARRARTIVATGGHLEMGVLSDRRVVDRHVVELDGSILCRAEPVAGNCLGPLLRGEASPEIDVVAYDVSGVPQPDRQRGSVRLRGRVEILDRPLGGPWRTLLGLSCLEPVLRFRPESVSVVEGMHGGDRPAAVSAEDYRSAAEDGLAGWESQWLTHLDVDHSADLRAMAALMMQLTPESVVHPLLADEDGLVLRVYDGARQTDLRIGFPWSAPCGCQAVAAFSAMVFELRSRAQGFGGIAAD